MKALKRYRGLMILARPAANERGSVIIVALLVLALGTIIGVAAITTSTTERQSAFNFLVYERTFYTAEAGLERAKEILKMEFSRQTAPGNPADASWNFILDGTTQLPDGTILAPATKSYPNTYSNGGVTLLNNQALDGNTYTVTIWDNNDEAPATDNPTVDKDRLIWVRSAAREPSGASCTIEILLHAKDQSDIRGYDTQSYGGPDKASTSNDKNAITDFTKRM
jgi:Tfp pilus assembly protein PilX